MPDSIEQKVRLLKALAEPTRLRIMELIAKDGENCVCKLAPILKKDQSVIFRHIRMLSEQGLLRPRRAGATTYYRIANPDVLHIIESLLKEVKMRRIAIASDDPRGLDSVVSYHFGRCPYYIVVEVDDKGQVGKITSYENRGAGTHQVGDMPSFIKSLGADVIVAGGMGPRAIDFFQQLNIQPITGASGTVRRVIEQLLNSEMETEAEPCDHSETEHEHSEAETEHSEVERLREEVTALRSQMAELMDKLDRKS